ncbi:MAG: FGGY-family carbohydrate kinase [Treponema sp.]|jgi:xylulokinase|nr:FGGY-family carbohydrate kinase [Treponema sp.]
MTYILAHDLGTSGDKGTLFSLDGKMAASALYEYPVLYPRPGWVEQDPEELYRAVCVSTRELLEKAQVRPADIAALCFSGQMMGCLLVDSRGLPLRNLITWADTRAASQAAEMEKVLGMERVYRITGHRISASYSAAKLLWVRDHEEEIYRRAAKMLLAKDYIVFRLTGRQATDYSDAGGTNLFDINKLCWSEEIVRDLGIPRNLLPEPLPSTARAGSLGVRGAAETGLLEGTAVILGGGDGSCACAGAGVAAEGSSYAVLGSSSWISLASKKPLFDSQMRTFNWVHLDGGLYTPCGTMQAAGFSYNWYRNTLCAAEVEAAKERGLGSYALIDEGARSSPPGAGGLLYLPYLLGERSPRWNHDARGVLAGLQLSTAKGDISRAILEGVGFNLKLILEILESEISEPPGADSSTGGAGRSQGQPVEGGGGRPSGARGWSQGGDFPPQKPITMIGGGAKGETWLQILADIWQRPLAVPLYTEDATSLGAAVCGGIGIGAFKDFSAARRFNPLLRTIEPRRDLAEPYRRLYAIFNRAYDQLTGVFRDLAEYRRLYS